MLLQVEWVKIVIRVEGNWDLALDRSRVAQDQAITLWDLGSNVLIVHRKISVAAGWVGFPVVQTLLTTGGEPKQWRTKGYWVPIVQGFIQH